MTEWPSGRAYGFGFNGQGFESLTGIRNIKFRI